MDIQPQAETIEMWHGLMKKKLCPSCGTRVEQGYTSDTFWCPQCNASLGIADLPVAVRTVRKVGAFEKITPLYWLEHPGDIYHAKSDYISQRAATKED